MPYKDRDRQREFQRLWKRKRREEYFRDKRCAFCDTPENLVLHHVDPEEKDDHRIWSWSRERREREIEKCIPLCQQCHTAVHNGMAQSNLGNYLEFDAVQEFEANQAHILECLEAAFG